MLQDSSISACLAAPSPTYGERAASPPTSLQFASRLCLMALTLLRPLPMLARCCCQAYRCLPNPAAHGPQKMDIVAPHRHNDAARTCFCHVHDFWTQEQCANPNKSLPQVALQHAIPRKDYQRILPPADAARENVQWVKRSVATCARCCLSLEMLANDPEMHYWDEHLERLFQKASPISAHGAHTSTYAYTHTSRKPGGASPRLPQCASRPPPLTRLEREWIRKRKTGGLPGMSGSSHHSGDGLPSLAQSLPANRPEYRWSATSSGRGGGSRPSTLETPRGGVARGAAVLSDEQLLAELQRRNLLPGEGGDAGDLGPPLAVVGADGAMAGSRVMPTPPRTPRPSPGGKGVGGDGPGGRMSTPQGEMMRGALGEVKTLKQGIAALCQSTEPRWEQLEGLLATFQGRMASLKVNTTG